MNDLVERLSSNARDCVRAADMDTDAALTAVQVDDIADTLAGAAAALEAAREGVKAVGTVLGGEFHYLRHSHGLPDGTMLYAIDQVRGKEDHNG